MGNIFSYPDSRIVETSYGQIQGRRLIYMGEKQVDAFQGIPYAEPPVGKLRFEKPHPPAKWSGIEATKGFRKRAIQAPILFFDHFLKGFPSEDCLYLNVFTPCWDPPKEGFPVMVFIHGGGFEIGETNAYGDLNICENIVTRDVIFVTIAYRLGYLGFFTTGDDVCPGNFGLWDQTAALRWVNENIEAFGGNKNNITLLGQSAGAVSTDLLHLSPHSTGLFHKMIPMAGTAEIRRLAGMSRNMPKQCSEKVSRLGLTDFKNNKELLDKLRTLPANKFAVEVKVFKKKRDDNNLFETIPYIDGDFFSGSIDEMRKNATPKPMMTGITKEEGILFIIGKKPTEDNLSTAISIAAIDGPDNEQLLNDLRDLYTSDEVLMNDEKMMRAIANVVSDYYMNAGALEMCRKAVTHHDEPVYLYVFDHFNPKIMGFLARMIPIQDTTHGCELLFLFKKGIFFSTPSLNDDDRVVMDAFTTAFTNFAKFGNPNGSDSSKTELPSEWLPVDKTNCGRNFVFTPRKSQMKDEFFEGRPAKYMDILDKHQAC
ncbi:hypothetical protein PMAYCL1PPCAC_07771 [Pristionchus mayeri]|uniref:Carboxylic ester hydrolase n=1 Tax=Pristionchus mayeri TaxID=1317129 RepID=A0AAN4ZBF9_9BILA|nr:hypothetical protein PMAYCL1PPCAC_07771 [Pristionchus mayeri]